MVHERLAVYSEELFSDRSDGNFPGGAIADLPFFMQLAQQPFYDRRMDLYPWFYHGTWGFLYDGI